MSTDTGEESTTLPPDDAFSVLGNETRIEILQTLGEADKPLSFSELRDRVGMRDSGQFNYHLDQLAGHFVRKSDDGYGLRQAGQRVIEAVLSGAVTETVTLAPTRLEIPCPYCSADVEVSYREERLFLRCTECVGSFGDIESTSEAFGTLSEGAVSLLYLPSAGFQGRTPRELVETTAAWTQTQAVLNANGICPRCSGTVTHSVDVCPDHQTDVEICPQCNTRFAVLFQSRCTNCSHERGGGFNLYLIGDARVRSFFESRGVELLSPAWDGNSPFADYEEEVLGMDPFEARFTFIIDGDALTVTVDDGLNVVDITEEASDPA